MKRSKEEALEIVRTGVNQLTGVEKGGLNRLTVMTGAKDFMYDAKDNGDVSFSFKLPNKVINYVNILYKAGADLYDVEMYHFRLNKNYDLIKKNEKFFESVYGDMLKGIFEEETGLYLTLF